MAERYEDQYRRDRGYRRDERGFMDRAGDEVRSWFGDDDAERRRQLDDRDRYRERVYGQSGEYGPGSYRGSMDRDWRDSGNRSYYGDRGYAGDRGYGNGSYYGDRASYWGDRTASGDRESYGDYRERPGYPGSFSGRTGFESRQRESFAGRGPKGYQRSDARITEDVCDRLCDSPDIDASAIEVRVSVGAVTLSGSVASRDEKRRAEDLIEQVSGVREVHNNLRVGRADESSSPGTAPGSTTGTAAGETPGSTLGLTGQPDRASTAGRK